MKVVVIRHCKENLKKCSMSHLHGHEGFTFLKARDGFAFDATGHVLLEIGAPPISPSDAGLPILLLDSTWALLPKLRSKISGTPILRSIPEGVKTAYPRISKLYRDPSAGLATVEALYAALKFSGISRPEILRGWHFAEDFLKINGWGSDIESLKSS